VAAQTCVLALFMLLVRYDESADSAHVANQLGQNDHLRAELARYPRKHGHIQ